MAPYDSHTALAVDTRTESQDAPAQVLNTRFGRLEIAADHMVEMPQGPFGFADYTRFALADVPNQPASQFRIFQALEDAQVSFIVLPAAATNDWIAEADFLAACRSYRFDPETSGLLLIVTMRRGPDGGVEASVNTKAPIVMDTVHRIARQVVFTDDAYAIRQPLEL
jgi:flagellar assembly factor FliW